MATAVAHAQQIGGVLQQQIRGRDDRYSQLGSTKTRLRSGKSFFAAHTQVECSKRNQFCYAIYIVSQKKV